MKRRELFALVGSAAAWSLATSAQQPLPVIGFLHQGPPEPLFENAFRKGLLETGLNVGRDVTIEDRWAEGHYDRLSNLAAELVDRRVVVIAAAFLPPHSRRNLQPRRFQ